MTAWILNHLVVGAKGIPCYGVNHFSLEPISSSNIVVYFAYNFTLRSLVLIMFCILSFQATTQFLLTRCDPRWEAIVQVADFKKAEQIHFHDNDALKNNRPKWWDIITLGGGCPMSWAKRASSPAPVTKLSTKTSWELRGGQQKQHSKMMFRGKGSSKKVRVFPDVFGVIWVTPICCKFDCNLMLTSQSF